jgi:hypothetical protein
MVHILAALGGEDCERIRSGWLAQPANAVSSLAYVGIGVWLLWHALAAGARRSLLVVAGAAMVAVGMGSFAYHGPQPAWADAAHDASIGALALALVADHVWLLARARPPNAATLLGAWRAAAPWIAAALLAYWTGRTASSLCRPTSLWQYHAAWHTLSALALGLVTARIGHDRVARVGRASGG